MNNSQPAILSGEITTPTITAFDNVKHIAWGNVTIENKYSPKVHLKQSETQQLGKRVEEFIRKTGCPVTVVMAYMNL